jgi:hypothetical protein
MSVDNMEKETRREADIADKTAAEMSSEVHASDRVAHDKFVLSVRPVKSQPTPRGVLAE